MTEASVWDAACEFGFSDPLYEPLSEEEQLKAAMAAEKQARQAARNKRRSEKKKEDKERQKRRAHADREAAKAAKSYDPVICRQCKEEIYYLVSVVVKCPLGWKNLTKDGIRHKQVSVVGAEWGATQFFCGCEAAEPGKVGVDKKLYRPGKRWTKGMVPDDPLRKTVNTSPIRKKKRKKNA